jgi:hypothetical protein
VTAAWANEPWILKGHGLKSRSGPSLGLTPVEPALKRDGSDSFHAVARATGGRACQGVATMGALSASLPESPEASELTGEPAAAVELVPNYESSPYLWLPGQFVRCIGAVGP